MDECAHPDQLSVPHSDRLEWTGVAGPPKGLKYRQPDNCFVWIADYGQAQKLIDQQLEINRLICLDGFGGELNPLHESLFEHYPADCYWAYYQSEWATAVVFAKADFLRRLMPLLDIPAGFNGTLETDLKRRRPGERWKYRMNGNSARFYDKSYSAWGSVLRVEEGRKRTCKWRPMRKGIADLHRREPEAPHAQSSWADPPPEPASIQINQLLKTA
jgi:hypothetical protein